MSLWRIAVLWRTGAAAPAFGGTCPPGLVSKEAEFATVFTGEFTSVATREAVPKAVLRRRLLLVLFALGTNMGIMWVALTGKHGESEAARRRVRHLSVNRTKAETARMQADGGARSAP
ncbi:Tn3 family transposase [Streptomyces sp. NPDC058545]|uniref:Tn3 family transposase n=1 Tax=Streptomyces sp. NPDC058545 TaxID=3346544 RepID=UPI0036474CFA